MMRKWISAIAAVLVTSTIAWAAGTTLTGLGASGAVADADTYYTVQTPGAGGVKSTALKMYTYIASKLAPIAASGSASDLSAGTLPAARMPALTGNCVTAAGAVATTCDAPHPGYIAANWYVPLGPTAFTTGIAIGANVIACIYGYVPQKVTVSQLLFRIGTGGSTNSQGALYTAVNGLPAVKIGETGNMVNTATGNATVALLVNKQIGPGGADGGRDVFFCTNSGDGTVAFAGAASATIIGAAYLGSSNNAQVFASGPISLTGVTCAGANCAGGSSTFGTWPATLAGSTWTRSTNSLPIQGFLVSSVP